MKLGILFAFQDLQEANYIHVFKMAASIGLIEDRILIFILIYNPILIRFASDCVV